MPVDAYRDADTFVIELAIPGVALESTRQLFLGETLDTERIDAAHDADVLTVRIPVAEQAEPRKTTISGGGTPRPIKSGQ